MSNDIVKSLSSFFSEKDRLGLLGLMNRALRAFFMGIGWKMNMEGGWILWKKSLRMPMESSLTKAKQVNVVTLREKL